MTVSVENLAEIIIKLGAEVRYLLHHAPHLEAEEREQRINQYQQAVRFVYSRAKKQSIELIPYYNALVEIETNLRILQDEPDVSAPSERVALFIDAANLDHSLRKQVKQSIDYTKLLEYFARNAFTLRAYYYTAVEENQDEFTNPFLKALKMKGYRLVTKRKKTLYSGRRKGNLDIEIAMDMLEIADKMDRVVLFSGDGDFRPVLERIATKGVRTEVVSYNGGENNSTANELIEAADVFIDLADIIDRIAR